MPASGANCFDASALVKVFTNERDGERVRSRFRQGSPTKYATPFCFYEAMNVLKSKWRFQGQLTQQQYAESARNLLAWLHPLTKYPDLDFGNPIVFSEVERVATKHGLDWSDAFQIVSVRDGFFARLVNDSATLLITADRGLTVAARAEGLRVWNCIDDDVS
jgi:predicted nucleic acid-binding protein